MFQNFFQTDESYRKQVDLYTKKEALPALVFWGAAMAVYYRMGRLYAERGEYRGVTVNLALLVFCIALTVFRKEKITTVGFTKKNAARSVLWGIMLGAAAIAVNCAIGLAGGSVFAPWPQMMGKLVYYMVVIALTEEVIFRGYMQTRLYGLIKKPVLSVALGGVLFMAAHIPFQMGYAGLGFWAYLQQSWIMLLLTVAWHAVFDFLYRRYNAIYGPVLFHGLLDWSNYLFL